MAQSATPAPKASFNLSQNAVLGLTLAAAAVFWLFSQKSPGFYQQDEAAHFVSMMRFWDNPNFVLSNWAKPGYKVLYALPALLGNQFVALVNCLVAAFCGFFAWKTASEKGFRYPLLAFVFLVAQPFWVALAFRNYSEIPSALLLIVGYYFHTQKKWLWAGLFISYIVTIRQEFYPIAAMYGLWHLYRKQWLGVAGMLVFPIAHHTWGWLASGDSLYLFNQILGNQEGLKDLYPRQGFDHYFLTSIVIFGGACVTLFVMWVTTTAIGKRDWEWFVLIPFVGYFLINCLINWQAHPIGPSTGGNLRYMLFVSPLIALMAAQAVERFEDLAFSKQLRTLLVALPLVFLVSNYMNFKHNDIKLTEEKDRKPLIGVFLAYGFLFIPIAGVGKTALFSALGMGLAFANVKPKKIAEEDAACKELAQWFKENESKYQGKQLFVEHSMFYYFTEKTESSFKPYPKYTSDTAVSKAPIGSLILWDSHYSYRPKKRPESLPLEYFTGNPTKFELVYQNITPDQTFGVLVFEKKQ